MSNIKPLIKITESKNNNLLKEFFIKHWGSDYIVSRGHKFYGDQLPYIMATNEDNEIVGLLTYNINENMCEVISIDSLMPNQGIGSMLMNRMIEIAKANQFSRLWLITTNDNTDSMRFYQKSGFVFKAVHINAIEKSRKLKKSIPKLGFYNIPIRDEIEFEYPIKK